MASVGKFSNKINIFFSVCSYFYISSLHVEFRSLQWLVLPGFFIFVISWAVLFLQFWKRKNSALLARLYMIHIDLPITHIDLEVSGSFPHNRFITSMTPSNRWGINCSLSEYKNLGNELSFLSDSLTVEEKEFGDVSAEKRKLQRNEWFGVLLRIRNNAIIVLAIICLQLPFELAYAHLYEITETEVMR